mmetsp:Transcript_39824/g.83236  ORF Transcript_39824/g.83236 Transcript_39824/m.83236 type:complete len:228 (+) Transcript_39824:1693-2376(+)
MHRLSVLPPPTTAPATLLPPPPAASDDVPAPPTGPSPLVPPLTCSAMSGQFPRPQVRMASRRRRSSSAVQADLESSVTRYFRGLVPILAPALSDPLLGLDASALVVPNVASVALSQSFSMLNFLDSRSSFVFVSTSIASSLRSVFVAGALILFSPNVAASSTSLSCFAPASSFDFPVGADANITSSALPTLSFFFPPPSKISIVSTFLTPRKEGNIMYLVLSATRYP